MNRAIHIPADRRLRTRRTLARWLRRALLVVIAAAVVGAIARAWLPKPVKVEWAIVDHGPLRVTVDEDGLARVEDRYVVSAPLSGSMSRIELEPGDPIAQGRTIASIVPVPPPLLDARTRRTAEAQVSVALAAQKQASAQIERARAALEFARTDAARAKELFERRALTRQELDQAELRERTAKAEHESARFGTRVADHELSMARAALSRLSAKPGARGERLEVPSPVAGRVLRVMQQSEGVVQAGTPLVELGDPGALEIVADVLTSDAVRIRPGALVIVDRWGGAPLEARVKRVEPSAFTRISALGVEEQRVNVRIDLTEPRARWEKLGDGYRVEVSIVVWESADAVKVPSSALFRHDGDWALFVIDGEHARLARVSIGERTASEVQIVSGVKPGQRVVIHPSDAVKDGVSVVAR